MGARERLSGDAKLAKLLDGRVAGEGRNCLSSYKMRRMQVIDGTAIVYRDGSTLWVNIPANAEHLDDSDVMVTRMFGSSLCRQDIVDTYDRSGHFMNGVIFLGDFVPYRRVDS
ncbi:hypothetical protein [Qipengyuania marisflavi]|uniref:hypothetical protein n=1 Tax=Qipengyuania marisflavi TaxID=2486356 RepID=UPI003CCC53D1